MHALAANRRSAAGILRELGWWQRARYTPSKLRCIVFAQPETCGWQVSSLGRLKDTHGRVSFGSRCRSTGYHYANIRGRIKAVHALVFHAFNSDLDNNPVAEQTVIHHIDHNRGNNAASNLKAVTSSQNAMYSHRCNPLRTNSAAGNSRPVMCRRIDASSSWQMFPSGKVAAEQLALSAGSVCSCCRGRQRTTGAYECVYVPDADRAWAQAYHPETGTRLNGMEVSECGYVRLSSGRVTRGSSSPYLRVTVYSQSLCVHRLILWSLRGPPPTQDCSYVNHIDSNKTNNSISNLEWVTPSENIIHSWATNPNRARNIYGVPVRALHMHTGAMTYFNSMADAERSLSLPARSVAKCLKVSEASIQGWMFERGSHQQDILNGEIWSEVHLPPSRTVFSIGMFQSAL
eukprot:TRINITY_DN75269_c0_g1_i1.p1 TRINITY_DN75269_c0_g1~~TRINITY_DN75269_c0_g1_i1.p1  ORF type:complete len:403 (+),score=22.62 TRINITY_DN75269_c0_g1_i1:46-1254(+)